MSVAAAQYDQFKRQAVQEGRVFTFTEAGEYLVFPVGEHEVIPFWSSRSRMEKIQGEHPKYAGFAIQQFDLAELVAWLPKLGEDRIRIGTNWSGKRLAGYDVEAKELLAGLEYWMTRDADR